MTPGALQTTYRNLQILHQSGNGIRPAIGVPANRVDRDFDRGIVGVYRVILPVLVIVLVFEPTFEVMRRLFQMLKPQVPPIFTGELRIRWARVIAKHNRSPSERLPYQATQVVTGIVVVTLIGGTE